VTRLSTLLDVLPLFIIVIDEQDNVTYANSATNDFFHELKNLKKCSYLDIYKILNLPDLSIFSTLSTPYIANYTFNSEMIEISWLFRHYAEGGKNFRMLCGINTTPEVKVIIKVELLILDIWAVIMSAQNLPD
jgi:hypothetical protein